MNTSIYSLIHPKTEEVRYIGKSTDTSRRLKDHIRVRIQTHVSCWIKSLLEEGLTPLMKILEVCDDNWKERERYWISYYKALGSDLTNHSPGGDGGGSKHSEETRLKMSKTRKGKPPGNIGVSPSAETRLKISESLKAYGNFNFKKGFKHSEESKLKMSISRKGVKRGPRKSNSQFNSNN